MRFQILGYFEIQTGHQILARKPNLVSINRKKITRHQVDFPAEHNENESENENERTLSENERK